MAEGACLQAICTTQINWINLTTALKPVQWATAHSGLGRCVLRWHLSPEAHGVRYQLPPIPPAEWPPLSRTKRVWSWRGHKKGSANALRQL